MELLSRRDYAKHRGCALSSVQEAISSGRITLTDGKIDPVKADKEWEKNTNPAYHGNKNNDTDIAATYQVSKTREKTYDSLIKKIEYEKLIGELIPKSQVEVNAFTAGRELRDLLNGTDVRIAPKILNEIIKDLPTKQKEVIRSNPKLLLVMQRIITDDIKESLKGFEDKYRGTKP